VADYIHADSRTNSIPDHSGTDPSAHSGSYYRGAYTLAYPSADTSADEDSHSCSHSNPLSGALHTSTDYVCAYIFSHANSNA
jgi:hypothetical protein